jgi:putative transposase
MARQNRERSESGYYHIMLRGIEKKNIFSDEQDRKMFLKILDKQIIDSDIKMHGYCLMDNHIHLLLKGDLEQVSTFMKKITVSYVSYFNYKFRRSGHLFQGRYKSEVIEDDSYLLQLIRYIHQNPVKAHIVKKADDYKWSSHRNYINNTKSQLEALSTELILGMFSKNQEEAIKLFKEYVSQKSDITFMDVEEKEQMTDDEAYLVLEELLKVRGFDNNSIEKYGLDDGIITELREKTGLSIRKIAVMLNMGKDRVHKALRGMDKDA